MTCGVVHASYSLPEWQAVKLTFFAPWEHFAKWQQSLGMTCSCIWGTEIKFEIKNYSLLNFFSVLYLPFFICSLFYIPYGFYRLLHQLQAKFSWANKSRVNLWLSPRGGLIYFKPIWGGLNRDGGLTWEGGGGLSHLETTMVSVLHKELEYKVEKFK